MMRSFVVAAALSVAAPAFAQDVYVADKNHSEVGFQIRHFVTKVRGRFTDFSGTIKADAAKPEASSVEFTIQATSIDTDVVNRDNDLRSKNFFEVETYPQIAFKSSKVTPAGKDRYDVRGTLTMHGVSKELTLPITFLGTAVTKTREGKEQVKAGFETSIKLNRKDFGIVWNRALDTGGFMLGDDVEVSINLETNKEAPPATN
jgi:polyisoprenoid-binding protein YceI